MNREQVKLYLTEKEISTAG